MTTTLHTVSLDLSNAWRGGLRDDNGRTLDMEELLQNGFRISSQDANVVLTPALTIR